MHVEAVRFDRVFDVVKHSGHFSFETGGKPVYGVRLPRRLIPKEGDTYLIALEKAGDFTAVLGWSEPGSGKMVVDDARLSADAAGTFDLVFMIVAVILCTGLSVLGKAGLVVAALALPVFLIARLWRRRGNIVEALRGSPPTTA